MILGLDHVQLAAPPGCEAQARHFFGELLGLQEIAKPQPLAGRGGVWFRCGEHELHVGVAEPFVPAVKAHPALRVAPAMIGELARRLAGAGTEPGWDDSLPGTQRFFVSDPWGNRLELVAAPG